MSSKKPDDEKPSNAQASSQPLTPEEELTSELIAQILSGRPQRLLELAVAQLPIPAEVAFRELAAVNDALAMLARDPKSVDVNAAPSAGLRDRILKTLAARR